MSDLELRRSARASERDVSAVSSSLDEDGLIRSVGDGLKDGEGVPGVDVSVDEEDVVRNEGGESETTIVLVGLLDLVSGSEVLSVNVLAEVNPVGDGNQISERLLERGGSLEITELSAGLVDPLAHGAGGGSVLSFSDHVGVAAVHAREGREEVVGRIDVSIQSTLASLHLVGEVVADSGDVVRRSLLVVLHLSLPVTHQVRHEGGNVEIRAERLADLELLLHLSAAGFGLQLRLDHVSRLLDGIVASGTDEVGQRLIDYLEVLVEVQDGLYGGRGSDRSERHVGILQAEEGGQGTGVAASKGDNWRVVGLVLVANLQDELCSVGQGLLGRKPFQIVRRQSREGLRRSVVTVLNSDLQCLVRRGIGRHSVRGHRAAALGTFSSELQKDGGIGSRATPVAVLNPVALSERAGLLVVIVVQSLLVAQGLNRHRSRLELA